MLVRRDVWDWLMERPLFFTDGKAFELGASDLRIIPYGWVWMSRNEVNLEFKIVTRALL